MSLSNYQLQINDVENGTYTGEYVTLGGGGDDGNYCSVRFSGVGSPDVAESTYAVSGGDGIQFGVERYESVNWTIEGAIHSGFESGVQGGSDEAWNSWSRLARAWTDYPGRLMSRAVVPLYVKRPGRDQMVVFGRPRKIDPDTVASYSGFIRYSAQFKQSDPVFYSAQEKTVTVFKTTSVAGGLKLTAAKNAFVLPFSTTSAQRDNGVVIQNGDTSSRALIRINGPISNPKMLFYGDDGNVLWSFELRLSILAGSWLDIDSRHWVRSVTDINGKSYAGYYIGNKLTDLKIPPGTHTFDFTGTDDTGTSTCQVFYRDAWSSI